MLNLNALPSMLNLNALPSMRNLNALPSMLYPQCSTSMLNLNALPYAQPHCSVLHCFTHNAVTLMLSLHCSAPTVQSSMLNPQSSGMQLEEACSQAQIDQQQYVPMI